LVIGEKVLYVTDETLGKKAHSSPVISCESSILDVARELSGSPRFKVHYGIIATTNKIIHLSSYKKLLGNTTYAIAVDMESFLIAEQSHNLGIPFIVVRAISDRADEDVAVCENLVNEKGNINVPAVSLYLFKKPYSIFTLKNLRKQAKFASRSLSEFLPDFITQIYNTLLK
jgi:adenosylhomocysteine nucleosidase